MKYTKEGVFRHFAFIGYETEQMSTDAVKFLHNTCINTNRISVENCFDLGSENKPKAWSKYSNDSSAYKKLHNIDVVEEANKEKEIQKDKKKKKTREKIDEIIGEHKNDPMFLEFMKTHNKGEDKVIWDNDLGLQEENHEVEEESIDEPPIVEKTIKKLNKSKVKTVESENENEDDSEDVKLAERKISDMDYMKSLKSNKIESTDFYPDGTPRVRRQKMEKKKKEFVDLFTLKISDVPYAVKKLDVLNFFKPIKPDSVRLPRNKRGFCFVGFKQMKEFKGALQKDRSFLLGKQVFLKDYTDQNKIDKKKNDVEMEVDEKSTKRFKWQNQEEQIKNEEQINESGRIFFRNLAYSVTTDDLQKVFETYGPISDVSLPIDPLSRKIKGFGVVTFLMPEHAVTAFNELDGSVFHGRMLHLIPAKSSKTEEDYIDENENNERGLDYKKFKEQKLKREAGSSQNWNTLFMGANAVANILSNTYGHSKEDILDTNLGGSSAAVRLALGETEIVIKMKKFLEENDVCLEQFETKSKNRSKTIILVKNLPADTTVKELQPLFAKFGILGRIVLPPSGVTALIEFLDPSEAKSAFKKLAYSKFKHLPLYLEWAPDKIFKTQGKMLEENNKKESTVHVENKPDLPEIKEKVVAVVVDEEDDEYPEPDTTLFLKNLKFSTIESTVQNHFKHIGKIHTVQVARKKDPENPQNKISLGYGFIQFKKRVSTERALKNMQMTNIDGNTVELKRSDRTLSTDVHRVPRKTTNNSPPTGSKIMVRNIPFQAKESEVKEIFKAFGEIKAARLPKKNTPGVESHRGFGFIEFFNKTDAEVIKFVFFLNLKIYWIFIFQKAFEALSQSTHLYGRRLILEWATIDEDVDQLRKRTANHFHGDSGASKKSKKSVFDASSMTARSGNGNNTEEEE